MIPLILLNLRHITRTRMMIFFLVFSFLVQFLGLKALKTLSISFQGVMIVGTKQAIFGSLFFQLFSGAFLAAVYGIWMAPYAHMGQRGQLTFALPVSRWVFPLVYGVCLLCLILLQHLVMFVSYAIIYGPSAFMAEGFPWSGFLYGMGLQALACEACMFALAFLSLVLGPIPTFFSGAMVFFVLQAGGALFRIDFSRFPDMDLSNWELLRKVYELLPPVGELVFDLRSQFSQSITRWDHMGLWGIWLIIFVVLFWSRVRFPPKTRLSENS